MLVHIISAVNVCACVNEYCAVKRINKISTVEIRKDETNTQIGIRQIKWIERDNKIRLIDIYHTGLHC